MLPLSPPLSRSLTEGDPSFRASITSLPFPSSKVLEEPLGLPAFYSFHLPKLTPHLDSYKTPEMGARSQNFPTLQDASTLGSLPSRHTSVPPEKLPSETDVAQCSSDAINGKDDGL